MVGFCNGGFLGGWLHPQWAWCDRSYCHSHLLPCLPVSSVLKSLRAAKERMLAFPTLKTMGWEASLGLPP